MKSELEIKQGQGPQDREEEEKKLELQRADEEEMTQDRRPIESTSSDEEYSRSDADEDY